MSTSKVGVIDYGSGNVLSVSNALEYLGVNFVRVKEAKGLKKVSHVILPGVGSYASAISRLNSLGFVESIIDISKKKEKPFLGICVGMQVLSSYGSEFGRTQGLDIVSGKVVKFAQQNISLPHIGWNQVTLCQNSPLFNNVPTNACFYFLHSYEFVCEDESNVIASSSYGKNFTASIQKDNLVGVQFHPEKSQRAGLQLLKNFCTM